MFWGGSPKDSMTSGGGYESGENEYGLLYSGFFSDYVFDIIYLNNGTSTMGEIKVRVKSNEGERKNFLYMYM